MGVYSDSDDDRQFRADWAATGHRLNMGKSCLRFTALGDVDLPLIARTVASTLVRRFIDTCELVRAQQHAGRAWVIQGTSGCLAALLSRVLVGPNARCQ